MMGLSILVPVYQESKSLEKFLHRMTKQTKNNYELVFVVDTSNENCLSLIDKYDHALKGKIRVVYNSKRQGRYSALKKATEIASRTYAIIVSLVDIFKDDFVEKINLIAKSVKTDIIEFHARSHNPIWFHGYLRTTMTFNERDFSEEKKSHVFAYTYPFEFNKIIKTAILKKAMQYPKINSKGNNSRFIVEIIFKCILFAKSYYAWNEKIVRSKKINGNNYNPIIIIKEWDKVIENEIFHSYCEALEYNKYFSSKIIYQAYIKALKNSHLQKKFNELLKKFNNKDFYDSNVYFLKNSKETNLLKQYKNKNSYKAHKEL